MAILTEEMILVKTRCKDMERVRNLNMFGSDLEDVSILKVSSLEEPPPLIIVCFLI